MLPTPILSQANLSALAKMVSNAGLQRLIYGEDFRQQGRRMKTLLKKSGAEVQEKCTFRDLIQHSHDHLLRNYRHEYLYKNALLNSYVLENYSLADTVILNEFKIGNSKADSVLVNGTNKVFEIKTELDNPDRLNSQLGDYYKAFSEVYVVVYHAHVERYEQLLDQHVGIMMFKNCRIEIYREARPDNSKLEGTAMLKALRKDEYLQVVQRLYGSVPIAQPVHLFKSCLEVISKFAADEVQSEFLRVIKQRINHEVNAVVSKADIPDTLRLSCYHSNLDQNEYLSLIKRLSFSF
ncbi:sce7726 family protein [Mucilaginibacter sp. 44-25]|uniref:sce7726 family protein n=1 Tax=Mucilaginibacter sp. 44-25 TaxID=1895794 RepID=UPI00095B0433|nr:sce7726 family protein [Mucilaginibacter sp. 44-25]OJW12773.1 MAG: hypothetical protein BGO48_02510 [Mucilaginibacter sp. 44-25]